MSLINKVLRDLEARERNAQGPPERPVLDDLRPASDTTDQRSGWPLRITGWVLVAAAIVAAMWWYVSPGRAGAAAHALVARSTPAGHTVAAPRARAPLVAARPQPLARRPVSHPPAPSAKGAVAPVPAPVVVAHAPPPRSHFVFRAQAAAISRRRTPLTATERARAAYRSAVLALQAGQAGRARAACKLALRLNPGALRPALLLATLDLQGARLRSARKVLRATLKRHPQALPAALLLAQVDLRRGQPAFAVRRLAGVRAVGVDSESYWALLAVSQWRAGDQVAARATYRSALRRFPRDGALWVGLGLVDRRAGQTTRAYRAWRHAAACPLPPVLARFVQAQLRAFQGAHQNR